MSYVNDSVNSSDKLNNCLKFYKVSKSCLADAGFDLRKWKTIVVLKITLIQ